MDGLVRTLPLLSSKSIPNNNNLYSPKFKVSETPKSRNPFLHFQIKSEFKVSEPPKSRNPFQIKSKFSEEKITRPSTRLFAAGFSEIEPDLNEDFVDRWRTNGVEPEDFEYGKWDGAHTYFETEKTGTMWSSLVEEYSLIGPPTGFQGLISWLFPPAIVAGMYFQAPGEYLYIGAAIFTIVFCGIEMAKPSEAHNFEPHIYNMERGARDKLIAEYNTMDIWDFNEKYGHLWDTTIDINTDDIMKR